MVVRDIVVVRQVVVRDITPDSTGLWDKVDRTVMTGGVLWEGDVLWWCWGEGGGLGLSLSCSSSSSSPAAG